MVARIPYLMAVPRYHTVASEVATLAFLRSSGLPIPGVFGYSPVSENEAETEYIFTEYIPGPRLGDVWRHLNEKEIISVLRQIVQLESMMMSIDFPVGGSLYYTQDLKRVGGKPGVFLEDYDGRFCIGPDTNLPMWYGKRSQLDIDRGPCRLHLPSCNSLN